MTSLKTEHYRYPILVRPVHKPAIWGGHKLKDLGRPVPVRSTMGESWECCDRTDEKPRILQGPFKGKSLTTLLQENHKLVVGDVPLTADGRFPLLCKFIDARADLSVQVHPNRAVARRLGGEAKNESWIILDAEPGAQLTVGFDPEKNVDQAMIQAAIENGTLEDLLLKKPVDRYQFWDIKAGLVHSIGKGIFMAEVQQNSNTTYRLYDYNRTDDQGNKRELHVDKGLKSLDPSLQATPAGHIKNTFFEIDTFFPEFNPEHELENTFHILFTSDAKITIEWKNNTMDLPPWTWAIIPNHMEKYHLLGYGRVVKVVASPYGDW